VNVWAIDKPGVVDSGRLIRQKMVEEVNRIVHQNSSQPNVTEYNFIGIAQQTGTQKAYSVGSVNELAPNNASWVELADVDYQKIWYSDDGRHSKSHNVNDEYALMLFRFKIESREKAVKKIVLAFEGYGTSPAGNGVTVKVWNHVAGTWQNAQQGTGDIDETISITLASDLTNYIDDDGYV